jgi:hypothetical protein
MKRLILASVFCLASTVVLRAQEKPRYQLIPPEKLFPALPASPSTGIVQGLDLRGTLPPASLELTFKVNPSAVCSVPLFEARVENVDSGIAITPRSTAAPMPQARVPAPACEKK